MNLSGIVVVSAPGRFDDCVTAIAAIPGVEVHHRDPSTHRFIVVQEAASVDDEMAGLLRLKAVPGVVLAEMVYHYFAEGETP